jgi:opacity protein-like surface antigen
MKNAPSSLRPLSRVVLILALTSLPRAGAATHLLEFYVGGAYGHADLRARDPALVSALPNSAFAGSRLGSFATGRSAYQLAAGIRTLEFLGAEIDYFDLGRGGASPSWSGAGALTSAHVSQKGEAAFAVLYLPLPVLDVYLKAGVARLETGLSASATFTCPPGQGCPLYCIAGAPCGSFSDTASLTATETTFAAGGGVEWKLGNWAIRGEYERFDALGEHPSLLSAGVTWSFL